MKNRIIVALALAAVLLGLVVYRGILIADHVPQVVGGSRTGRAYSIGYIKALYDTARIR